MTKSGVKRLAIGATVVGAVVAGAVVVAKRRKVKALLKKGIGNAKSKHWEVGLNRGALRAKVSFNPGEAHK